MKWASREITSCFISRQAAGFHFSHKEDLEAWQKRWKWELPLRTIRKIWTSTHWVAHRSTDGHKWPPVTPCRPLPSNTFSSCWRNFVYLTYIWPGTFFNTSSQIYLTIHTLMSSLSLLLECEATDCVWHTGVIGIVTMCPTSSWTGCIYGRLIRILSSFWSFCPLLVICGQAAFVFLCHRDLHRTGSGCCRYHWFSLLIRTGELMLGILDSEGRDWWVEKEGRQLDCPSPAQTITDKLEGQVPRMWDISFLNHKSLWQTWMAGHPRWDDSPSEKAKPSVGELVTFTWRQRKIPHTGAPTCAKESFALSATQRWQGKASGLKISLCGDTFTSLHSSVWDPCVFLFHQFLCPCCLGTALSHWCVCSINLIKLQASWGSLERTLAFSLPFT